MNTLKVISVAWLITWGFMYVFAAVSAPGISGDASQGIVLYSLVGIATIIGVILTVAAERKHNSLMRNIASVIMFVLFFIEVYSALASWAGLVKWNVPFQNIEVFQVTMSFMDFISAVFLLLAAVL